jgi:hypothetical protein
VIIPLYVMDDLLLMRNARLGFRNVVLRQAKVGLPPAHWPSLE